MTNKYDQLLLLIVGILCALAAWLFWYLGGEIVLKIFPSMIIILLLIDNIRLRKCLKKYDSDSKESSKN